MGYISKIHIESYKCFRNLGPLNLDPGINVIVGQNNAGKTALLEALSLRFDSKPHRSLNESVLPTNSLVHVSLNTTLHDLRNISFTDEETVGLPVAGTLLGERRVGIPSGEMLPLLRAFAAHQNEFIVSVSVDGRDGWAVSEPNTLGNYKVQHDRSGWTVAPVRWFMGDRQELPNILITTNLKSDFSIRVGQELRNEIFMHSSTRQRALVIPVSANTLLTADGSNLAEVLPNLADNPAAFAQFKAMVRELIPGIQDVTTPTTQVGKEIRIWMHDSSREHPELTVPLIDAGAGVTQVFALLYLLVTSKKPRTIIIDEPQLYLHPGAQRVLVEILRRFSQHQFIVATHSPVFVSAAQPGTVILVTHNGQESAATAMNGPALENQRVCIAELGASIEEVFGARAILWVEGKTEEICFPRILAALGKEARGAMIKGVVSTGDFDGKHAELVLRVYEKLTQPDPLLPLTHSYLFDREARTSEGRNDLIRRSKGRMSFLPKRMFENYLLDENAVAEVLSEEYGKPISSAAVRLLLDKKFKDVAYFKPLAVAETNPTLDINGSRVLQDLFLELSEKTVRYDKIFHSAKLLSCFLRVKQAALRQITDSLSQSLKSKNQAS